MNTFYESYTLPQRLELSVSLPFEYGAELIKNKIGIPS